MTKKSFKDDNTCRSGDDLYYAVIIILALGGPTTFQTSISSNIWKIFFSAQ